MPENETIVTPTADGGAEVVINQPKVPRIQASDDVNLVPSIEKTTAENYTSIYDSNKKLDGKAVLKEIGQVVVSEYETDKASRSEWEENTEKALKLFTNFMGVKNFPWTNASNVNLPMMAIAILQFQARAYDAIIPTREIVKVFDPGGDDLERADRVDKYMNYQLLYKMENFEAHFDKTLIQLPLEGSVFKKTYRDFVKKQNVSEYISAMDFVMNYGARSLEDATRQTHIIRLTKNDIRKRVNAGVFIQEAWDLKVGSMEEKSSVREMADKSEGIEEAGNEYNRPRVMLEQHRDWDLDGDGVEEPYVITVDKEKNLVLRIVDRTYTDSEGKKLVDEYFTEYTFFPNPEGSYGLGFGTLLRGLNESANSIVNEVIDAGMLANLQGGFFLRKSGLKAQDLKFERGQYKAVDAWVDDIRKALFTFDFKGPNQTLYATLGLLYEYSKLVSSISETMTGQMPASDTPATTVLALIEEGRKVFSTIHKRIHRSFKKELKKLYRLNSRFLDDSEYFRVLGKNNLPEGDRLKIGRTDFIDTYDIVPVSDPTITSRAEKIAKQQQVVQDIRTNPLTANNPEANFIATKRYYEILEVQDIDALLKPPVPPDLSPEEENAGFIMQKPATVLPKQNQQWHLQVLQTFLQGDFAQQLTPEGRQLAEQHGREHMAQLYLQQAKLEQQQLQQIMGGMGGGGTTPNI